MYKNSEKEKLLLNLAEKINEKRNAKHTAFSSLSKNYTWKNANKVI